MCCRMTALDERSVVGPMLVWLDALEKDFDKAFVDLDLLLGEIDSDQVTEFSILIRFFFFFFHIDYFTADFVKKINFVELN